MQAKKIQIVLCFALSVMLKMNAQPTLRVFSMDREALLHNKEKLIAGKKELIPAYQNLLKLADQFLKTATLSVMEKKQLPPSGDKHDYMSIAIYYWPDPSKPDGLPYIRKDGQINPEVKSYMDKNNLVQMADALETLSLAYFFSGSSQYAEKAEKMLRDWFLADSTRMNPNLNFAQAVKGKNDGRGAGIIESRVFIKIIDAVGLIESDPSWKKTDQKGMEKWFSEYLSWMTSSKIGIDEMKAKNNHGVWYDAQKLSYALFTHNEKVARQTIESIEERLDQQMDERGFFPAELERTISLHYAAFIMEPLFLAANMSDYFGKNLWNEKQQNEKSLKKAFYAVEPYLSMSKQWPYEQIKPFDFKNNATPLLALAASKLNCTSCRPYVSDILKQDYEKSLLHLTTFLD